MYQGTHQFLLEFPLNELERPDVLAALPIHPVLHGWGRMASYGPGKMKRLASPNLDLVQIHLRPCRPLCAYKKKARPRRHPPT